MSTNKVAMNYLLSNPCPLADCTAVVDNVDNIYNSSLQTNPKRLLKTSLMRSITALQRQQALSDAPPLPTEATVEGWTPTLGSPVALRRACSEAVPECRTPGTVYAPLAQGRHDPYGPCVLDDSLSAESSFLACYSDLSSTQLVDGIESSCCNSSSPMQTPTVLRGATPSARPSPVQHVTVRAYQLPSSPSRRTPPSSTEATPSRNTPHSTAAANAPAMTTHHTAKSDSSPAARAKGRTQTCHTTTTTPAARGAVGQTVQQGRVVRTVMRCGVDRSSGRPIPKPVCVGH